MWGRRRPTRLFCRSPYLKGKKMDRPILFSGPMVGALLEGGKTQTRRVLASDKKDSLFNGEWSDSYVLDPGNADWRARDIRFAIGDRLWVREAWRCNGWATDLATIFYRASEGDGYTAMCEQYPVVGKPPLRVTATWRPGIHMPRWASRLTLTVTDVRVQRVQEISEADAEAEGTAPILVPPDGGSAPHVEGFRDLWDSINASRGFGWETNPWVVALTFTVRRQNIDALAQAA